ncbi:unnamed protein product [Heligmosomoides polygyrus]|uniref:non-specific serine/threonine protein kinase n=1 Tax=Heligmosomoides polygyrus TaxID=6339 RepID=A0A3P7YK49_HELPZ|nr:unnamed protein product [Heligmosomoides polygyrus]
MKVARGRNSEGVCVWKVFLTQVSWSEPSFVFRIRDALMNAPNCCTVKRIYVTPKWAVLIRPFQKQTLCDRLSSRPYIVPQEKIWYIYQLFKAIAQCQKANVCHGDLKSENVLLSSSNWLQITDFAPFKPTYLPHDNPSSFTFFFDTSRHQHCYLAPERFLSSLDYEINHKEKGDEWLFGSLEPSMDLFSAGCVVYELLHESGKPPFSYGELCHYRRMSSSEAATFLERLLSDIASQFRPLLKMLLNREPSMRITAPQVLDGSVLHFPKVLDSFFSYLNAFRPKELSTSQSLEGFEQSQITFHLEPDDVIAKLKRDENSIWERLTENDESKPYAVLFISLITANIRVLRSVPAKIDAMNLLVRLASLCCSVVSTERVLPYLVCCLSEPDAQVRASAVHSITELLRPIEPATFEDSLVFIDYLLPELVGHLPLISWLVGFPSSEAQQAADEKTALQKALSDLFEMLCSSQDNSVRHCAVNRESLAKLYTFFGRMNCGEILLRHMITFLNVKSDWRLRAVFFESLPICVQKNSFDVKPLLQQGLHDFEELVVVHAIHCIIVLVETGVLGRNHVLELLHDTLPFLSHPNEWIRLTVVELLILLDSRWSLADVHCRLLPMVRPYLQDTSLLRLNNKVIHLALNQGPDRMRFASASLDGYVLLWNSRNAVGDGVGPVRSDASFLYNKSKSEEARLSRVRLPKLEGPPEQLHVSNNVTYLRSHHGVIYCLDLRVGRTNGSLGFHEVWRREVVKYHGLVTSFCVDPIMENWMAMCSTNNELMLWDLRFKVEVNAWKTPHGLLPLRMWSNPLSSTTVQTPPEVFVAYGSRGEVDVFELGTTSPTKLVGNPFESFLDFADSGKKCRKRCCFFQDDLRNVTMALCVCADTGYVYTGDTEGSLRRWNLSRAPLCEYISGPRQITCDFDRNETSAAGLYNLTLRKLET